MALSCHKLQYARRITRRRQVSSHAVTFWVCPRPQTVAFLAPVERHRKLQYSAGWFLGRADQLFVSAPQKRLTVYKASISCQFQAAITDVLLHFVCREDEVLVDVEIDSILRVERRIRIKNVVSGMGKPKRSYCLGKEGGGGYTHCNILCLNAAPGALPRSTVRVFLIPIYTGHSR